MAEEQQQPLAAAYPAPPPFYKHFTDKNVARLKGLQQNVATVQGGSENEDNDIDIPAELKCLIPPEPPDDGKFRSFGGDFDVSALEIGHLA